MIAAMMIWSRQLCDAGTRVDHCLRFTFRGEINGEEIKAHFSEARKREGPTAETKRERTAANGIQRETQNTASGGRRSGYRRHSPRPPSAARTVGLSQQQRIGAFQCLATVICNSVLGLIRNPADEPSVSNHPRLWAPFAWRSST